MTGRRFGVRLRVASIQGAQPWGAS
jgi:hypothetical protein